MIQTNPITSRIGAPRRSLAILVVLVVVIATMVGVRQSEADAVAVSYAMIGDSITWQATADLEAAIPGIRVDGVIGRSFSQVGERFDAMMAGGTPDVLIIALGTNPPMTLSQVDAFMEKAGAIGRVFFVNIRIPRDWESGINKTINSLPQRYANVSVIDWYAFSGDHPEVFNTSGFHLSDPGKPVYAEFVAASVFSETEECVPPTQTEQGSKGVGTVDPQSGVWYLRDPLTGDTTSFYYGNPGDEPFMGDWDGDGVDTPGLYRRSDGYAYLRNSNTQGVADVAFLFGNPGDLPVPGDFNGDGSDTLSLFRPSENRFYIINALGSGGAGLGAADYWVDHGEQGDQPISGDFDGDGIDTIGIYRPSSGLVSIAASPNVSFYFGSPNDYALAGAFDGGPTDTIGVFRSSNASFYLRSSLTPGPADHAFRYGLSSHNPITGFFGTLPGDSTPPQHDFCAQP
jgi:hypothetical protein